MLFPVIFILSFLNLFNCFTRLLTTLFRLGTVLLFLFFPDKAKAIYSFLFVAFAILASPVIKSTPILKVISELLIFSFI